MDLLTVLAHELGHVIGREHDDDHDVMAATLAPGEQALPGEARLGRSGQRSAISGQLFANSNLPSPASSLQPLVSSLPSPASGLRPSDFAHPSSVDRLFARLDDDAVASLSAVSEEDEFDEPRTDEAEDGLDLWSVLYGLK
jgi:hypothetical protein